MSKPKKWHDVYHAGTKDGEEEAKVFKALSRNPKWNYLSVSSIVKATGLKKERVEEIIDKYTKTKPPMIFAHQENDDSWGYWERCPERLETDKRSIAQKDIDRRIAVHRKCITE